MISANTEFYRAFESLDMDRMSRAWAHRDDITCVHPGWEVIKGWEPVEESWLRIFEGTESMKFMITDVKGTIKGDLGVVVCEENIESSVMTQASRFGVVATNIFERIDGRWLVIHHHGSPVSNYFVPPSS